MTPFESYITILLTAVASMMLLFSLYAYSTYRLTRDVVDLAREKIEHVEDMAKQTGPRIIKRIKSRLHR